MLLVFVCSLNILAGATAAFQVSLNGLPHFNQSRKIFVQVQPYSFLRPLCEQSRQNFLALSLQRSSAIFFFLPKNVFFVETATILLNGVMTTKRPGNEISQLNLGPLAAIGSFKI